MPGLTIETNRLSIADEGNLRRRSFDACVTVQNLHAAATLFCYDAPLSLMNIHDTSFIIVFEEIKISSFFKSG